MLRPDHPVAFRVFARSKGMSMMEVLMTIIIMTFGLLGLAALQGRAHTGELESYQRGQALILLQDMVDRMESNTSNAASYVTATPVGTSASDATDCTSGGTATRAATDLCEWSKALKGSAEMQSGSAQGAMINGRGCVQEVVAGQQYLVSVVWQGISRTKAPTTTCGSDAGLYDSAETRRAVTALVQL
jgi:type IV pilus assembly protein PilV